MLGEKLNLGSDSCFTRFNWLWCQKVEAGEAGGSSGSGVIHEQCQLYSKTLSTQLQALISRLTTGPTHCQEMSDKQLDHLVNFHLEVKFIYLGHLFRKNNTKNIFYQLYTSPEHTRRAPPGILEGARVNEEDWGLSFISFTSESTSVWQALLTVLPSANRVWIRWG